MMGLFGDPKKKAAKRSAKLREEAMKNARKARETIGDETIQKIAQALSEQNKSAGKKAQEQIREMDKARVAEHLRSLLNDSD